MFGSGAVLGPRPAFTMTEDRIPLLAHRGFAAHYPENTLLSLRRAIDGGVQAVEFDIQLSADRLPVLMHDASLSRTCGVDTLVWDLGSDRLRLLGAGEPERLGRTFEAERVPTLDEAVALLRQHPSVAVFAEVKKESVGRFGTVAVLEAVLPALEPLAEAGNPCVVISFVETVLCEVRRRAPLPIGWCLSEYDDAARTRAQALSPEYLLANHRHVPTDMPLWSGPWQWVIYEVVDTVLARRLVAQGATMIETMDPPALAWGRLE